MLVSSSPCTFLWKYPVSEKMYEPLRWCNNATSALPCGQGHPSQHNSPDSSIPHLNPQVFSLIYLCSWYETEALEKNTVCGHVFCHALSCKMATVTYPSLKDFGDHRKMSHTFWYKDSAVRIQTPKEVLSVITCRQESTRTSGCTRN